MKKLYWSLSDNYELSGYIVTMEAAREHIETDMNNLPPAEQALQEYTFSPVWMTEEEFNNLPEYQF